MNVANKVNSKGDALNALAKNGVSSDIVTKVNGYLNNPMAGFIAKAAGVDLNKVKNIVGDLQGTGGMFSLILIKGNSQMIISKVTCRVTTA